LTDIQKYQIGLAIIGILFVYLIFTEVAGRWSDVFRLYGEVSVKEESVLNPDELNQQMTDLRVNKRLLTMQLTRANEGFEQSQIGVVRLIQTRAKEKNMFLRMITPMETRTIGQMVELGFSLELVGSYHHLGSYLTSLETGPIPIKIVKVEAVNQQPGSAVLVISVQGKAFILSKSVLK
jgi:Tfp pilus assembly protein PilO